MKLGWVIIAAGVLAGCGQKAETPVEPTESVMEETVTETEPLAAPPSKIDYAALSGYGPEWYVSGGWPGEYPPGFAIVEDNVSVSGRAVPRLDAPRDVACPLPRLANYQIWNNARNESDELDYFVATKTFPVTLTQDASIEFAGDNGIGTLDLKAGDQLTYLRYLGEGFTILSYDGVAHDINEAELRDISDIGSGEIEEHLWISVACTGGNRAWLKYDETIKTPGILPSPILGFGEAYDLSEDQIEVAREQARQMDAPMNAPVE